MRSVGLLILLAIAPAVWSQTAGERSSLDVIDDCSNSADEDTYGLTDLESECPGLTRALEETGYLPLLSAGARSELDKSHLSDLLTLDGWYDEQRARKLDVGTLGPILDSLHTEKPEQPPSWWERFVRWLRELLERRANNPDDWLSRWFHEFELSDLVVRGMLLAAVALLIGIAVAVLRNELRAAGILRQRPALSDPAAQAGASGAASDDVTDLDALSVDRKAPLLLRMLVATLVRSGRLRTERGLTYRELCTRATFDDAEQRDCFRRVATLAERTVYGNGVSVDEVEPMVAAARALDAQLRAAPV